MAQILVDREGNRFNPSSQIQIGDVIYYNQNAQLSEEVIAHYGLRTIDTTPFESKPADYDSKPELYYVTETPNVPYFVYSLKSQEQIESVLVTQFTQALEAHYDLTAQQRQYDSRYTCALRAGYPSRFQAEGLAFGEWMDNCNDLAYQLLADIKAGKILAPAPAAFIATLPAIVWPD
jgi:hypothetical protein